MAFADDTYILRVGDSFKENCDHLTADYQLCKDWADSFGMAFGPEKLEVMNFSRRKKDVDQLKCKPSIPGFMKEANADDGMKALGLIWDHRLSYDLHMKHIQNRKVLPLLKMGKRIMGSEIGLPFH